MLFFTAVMGGRNDKINTDYSDDDRVTATFVFGGV